jgi:DNA-binding NarL/FixJ family response regulator
MLTFDMDEYVYESLRAGASGFLLKDVPPEQLVAGIHTVISGEALLALSVTRRMIEEVRLPPGTAVRVKRHRVRLRRPQACARVANSRNSTWSR